MASTSSAMDNPRTEGDYRTRAQVAYGVAMDAISALHHKLVEWANSEDGD